MPKPHTPNEHNQLRKGRAVALLIHYKNRLLDERGLPDEDTLTDLLADLCHAHGQAKVGIALCSASTHHEAEVSAAAVSLPVTEDEGDDLCDQCVSSGVQVTRTDEAGNTVCAECDTVSLPADKAVWCIFGNIPDEQIAWHDEHGMPVTFPTERDAQLHILDVFEDVIWQVKAGEEQTTVCLAIHRWVRNRGGVTRRITIDVFHQREGQKPRTAQHGVFILHPE